MEILKMDRAQFTLTPVAHPSFWEDHKSIELNDGWVLSVQPGLRVQSVTDRGGTDWHLLGIAAQTDPSLTDPAEQLRTLTAGDDPRQLYVDWTGRWLLVGRGEIHLDATGLLGCFYNDNMISSTPRVFGSPVTHAIQKEDGINWFPPPLSGIEGVRRLLPSQVLSYASGEIKYRPLLAEMEKIDYEDTLSFIASRLTQSMKALSSEGYLQLPLTAGYDSRLLLAVMKKAGVPFSTFTQAHEEMSHADRVLPPALAKIAGVEHRYIPRKKLDPAVYSLYEKHSAGHAIETDRHFMAYGQFDWAKSTDVIVRGGAFEVGRTFYWGRLQPELQSAAEIVSQLRGGQSHAEPAIDCWLEWVAQHPEALDWRDRLYWEQRVGGWMSSTEQALDIVAAQRATPANSARLLTSFLSIPSELRSTSAHHVDLIKRLAPDLLTLPINPKPSITSELLRKGRRVIRRYIR